MEPPFAVVRESTTCPIQEAIGPCDECGVELDPFTINEALRPEVQPPSRRFVRAEAMGDLDDGRRRSIHEVVALTLDVLDVNLP